MPKLMPFEQAVNSFAMRKAMPEARFKALAAEIGDRARSMAFSVAGVVREDVLTDIYGEVLKAIEKGQSFSEFRDGIDAIMQKRGWEGLSPHRLDNIFRTNLQTAYNVGRYKQMMDVAELRPYWQYDAVNDSRTRPSHLAQDGKVYHHLHPYWNTWYPPNGYRCRCRVVTLSKEEMDDEGLQEERAGTDLKPDEGFRYNPGKAAWGEGVAKSAISQAMIASTLKWESLSKKGPGDFGRPEKIPYAPMPDIQLDKRYADYLRSGMTEKQAKEAVLGNFRDAIGGEEVQVADAAGEPLVLSQHLFDHLTLDGREAYFPLLRDVVAKPFEIWLTPEQARETGKVRLMKRYIKFYEDEKKRHVMMVAESNRGTFTGYTFFRGDKRDYFEKFRAGQLLFGE